MIAGRDAMILSLLVPPGATVQAGDAERLAAQFGLSLHAVEAMAERLRSVIREAGSTLDACQPRDANRCPHCHGVLA